jgi:hypothetical protein
MKKGDKVFIRAFDITGYGIVVSVTNGIHVLVDGYNEPMYFRDFEIKKVINHEEN